MSAREIGGHAAPQHGGHDTSHAVRIYLIIFAALGALTLATVGVAYMQLPHAAGVVVALVIAATKIFLIAAFFMHLRMEGRLINWSLAVALGLVLVLIVFVLPDIGVHELELEAREAAQKAAMELHGGGGHAAAPAAH